MQSAGVFVVAFFFFEVGWKIFGFVLDWFLFGLVCCFFISLYDERDFLWLPAFGVLINELD